MNTKILVAIGAVALSSTVVHADIESANVCGYQNIEIINGWSLFTPTFKKIGAEAKINLSAITPKTLLGETIHLKDDSVFIKILNDEGNYSKTYNWGGLTYGAWFEDGTTKPIGDTEVMIGEGVGIAVYNNVRTSKNTGAETTATFQTDKAKIVFQVSGEVDFVCKNLVINGWSLNGNSTPVPINLKDIIPQTVLGETIHLKDDSVFIKLLNDEGNYDKTYNWGGLTYNAWFEEGATKPIGDAEVILQPGDSFAIYNNVRTSKSSGAETTATFQTDKAQIYLVLPIPGQK